MFNKLFEVGAITAVVVIAVAMYTQLFGSGPTNNYSLLSDNKKNEIVFDSKDQGKLVTYNKGVVESEKKVKINFLQGSQYDITLESGVKLNFAARANNTNVFICSQCLIASPAMDTFWILTKNNLGRNEH